MKCYRNAPAPEEQGRIALITGITGQDGAYLAELLLSKGYTVHGIKRRSSSFNSERIDHLYIDPHTLGARFFLHYGDMTDSSNLIRIVQDVQPDEIYNLAAQWSYGAPALHGASFCTSTISPMPACFSWRITALMGTSIVGVGEDVTIKELALIIKQVVGFVGDLVHDTSKPNGTPRKLLSVNRLNQLGWRAHITLNEGLRRTYEWWLKQDGVVARID
jgi:nucleoside-diphosphate-sugar epimerase